jgi:hypothetical protein
MIGTHVISGPGWIRMIGVPSALLIAMNELVIQFVAGRAFCAGMPAMLPAPNVSLFLDVLIDMLAEEVIAKGRG